MKSPFDYPHSGALGGIQAPTPRSQSACEKAGTKWDSAASAPNLKCNSGFA